MRRFDWTMGHARTQGRLLRVCGAPEHRSARTARTPTQARHTGYGRQRGSGAALGAARTLARLAGAPALKQPMTTPHLEIILDRIHND